jgi:glutamate-1-semialdehyde 2,1-aminomutase
MPASLTDTRSSELYQRALELLPGGVNSPVRAMRAIGRDPIFIERAAGAELFDVDGNRYVDYVCSWGPMIHGHAHPLVLAAAIAAAKRGTSFGAPTAGEIDLAGEISRRMDSVDMLRMTSSGTEATMTAIRLARAATGRERIVKFAGAYHGHLDALLAQAGSGLATQALPSSPGVPASTALATTVSPWNDFDALIAATEGGEPIAAIIAEPLPANMGLIPPHMGFLELLRERADACGALLVFDEVISGFRVARGGAQELAGVRADLTVMGKVMGGGLPAGAVGGRAELMQMLAPSGEVYQAGTLSGNPLAVAAGLATLELLDDAAYLRLASLTEQLATGLRKAARAAGGDGARGRLGYPVQVVSVPGLLTVFFSETQVNDLADAEACDRDAYATWCRELLARGVYAPASQFEAWFPSLAHTPEQLELTIAAATAAFVELG